LISFAAAAVFLLSANIFLAVLLNNDVNTNLDRTLAQSALPILGQANHSRATLLSQVGILALYDVVVVTAKSSAGTTTRISVGPPAGLAELQRVGGFPRVGTVDYGGWRFYHIAGPGGETSVIIGAPLDTITQTHRDILIEIVIMSLTSLVIIAILSAWTISIGIRPLSTITAIARSIAEGARGTRVSLEQNLESTEVGEVAQAFNAVLVELEGQLDTNEELVKELRQLVADAGHELRTPLTSISGYAQLLASRNLSPEATADSLGRITAETSRMTRLIEDLLQLARMEGRVGMRYEYFDVVELIHDQVADHQIIDPSRPVTITGSPSVHLEADYDHVSQVIGNLLVNLRTHTPAGTEAAINVTESSGNLRITYIDTGPGVSEPDLLFQRFWRSPGSDSPGTGLGMSIVSGIVRAHRGTIRATSAEGNGLRLEITLPLVQPASVTKLAPGLGTENKPGDVSA
jgi:two-component system OmpR family sensor kinase